MSHWSKLCLFGNWKGYNTKRQWERAKNDEAFDD